jgi:integrase/recombinase XerD
MVIKTGFRKPEGARMNKHFSFSQVVEGYLLAAQARRLSEHTIADYCTTFRKFQAFFSQLGLEEDPPFVQINHKQVEQFLAAQTVAKKTLSNYHIGLSALWTWAVHEELTQVHVLQKVERAKPEKRAISPFSEDDLRAMLNSLKTSKLYSRPGKRECTHSLPFPERTRAMILLLLDTGMRASELCDLRINHVDVRNKRIRVFGKGSKERFIPFSARTGQALWKYLATRKDDHAGSPLFATKDGDPLDRSRLLKILISVGERAGVMGVHPHRFRHTFAVNYLRNGGDAYSLQLMLGHSTMEMVKTYLSLAQADLDRAHLAASPVDHWRL